MASFLKLHEFIFVASVYCSVLEFVCDSKLHGSLGTSLMTSTHYNKATH